METPENHSIRSRASGPAQSFIRKAIVLEQLRAKAPIQGQLKLTEEQIAWLREHPGDMLSPGRPQGLGTPKYTPSASLGKPDEFVESIGVVSDDDGEPSAVINSLPRCR